MKAKGKKISEFEYHQQGQSLKLDLRLMTEKDGSFTYRVVHDQPPLDLSDKDPNTLKKMVREQLDLIIKTEWKKVLCIAWESNSGVMDNLENLSYGNMEFKVEQWEVGNTTSGQQVHRDPLVDPDFERRIRTGLPHILDQYEEAFDNNEKPSTLYLNADDETCKKAREKKRLDQDFWTSNRKGIAYRGRCMIDDTPENREKIKQIILSMDELSRRMSVLFKQENIEKTLTLAGSGLPLLSAETTKELPHG